MNERIAVTPQLDTIALLVREADAESARELIDEAKGAEPDSSGELAPQPAP